MNILLAAATEAEIHPTLSWLEHQEVPHHNICTCITGVGLLAATYALTRAVAGKKLDCVIQAGIGGSFDKSISLGECVVAGSDQLADLGAEDGEEFIDVFSLGFADKHQSPFTEGRLVNPFQHLPFNTGHLRKVPGLTVLTTSGHEATIAKRMERYNAVLESMEGAALHYVCLQEGVPFLQLRAISNYVTRRDRNAWEIGAAVGALNEQLTGWLK